MKTTFVKLMLLVVVLAVALTGCNLIEVDPVKQAAEDIAKIDKNMAVAVATYGDGQQVLASDVMATFNNTYSQMYYMYYYYYGYELTETDVNDMMTSIIQEQANNQIIASHFDELGLALTDEETAECAENAQATYDETYASYLEQATGKTDEAKDADTRVALEKLGYNYDILLADNILLKKVEKVQEAVRAEITEVTDEELQTAYDEAVAADQDQYTTGSSAFETAMSDADTTVYYIPEGYRTVKHILVKPEDEVLTAYTDAVSALSDAQTTLADLQSELAEATAEMTEAEESDDLAEEAVELRSAEEINADIVSTEADIAEKEAAVKKQARNCLANVQDKTVEIYDRLNAGEDFEALIEEYGEDPGMQNEPSKTRGYYVCENSTAWEQNFTDAAMSLENIGDYTTVPVVSGSGVHIIKYMSDAASGAVALEDVRDALYEDTLETMRSEHYTETLDAWVEENNPVCDIDTFKAVIEKVAE